MDTAKVAADQIWLSGSVLTPTQPGVKWPNKIYVRDMAQAFSLLEDLVNTGDISEHFLRVFNGMPWKPLTFYLNCNFWFGLPEHIRNEACLLPCNPAGLWTTWRKGRPGWNKK